ncbi:MAG: HlyD family efflux transporter periplasmic adaptor subunit, partial [Desulfuromusa sp.]|nr:HlyD family efflux transporter periplasmic adaptor subunit [Desulfuromusa sp.]
RHVYRGQAWYVLRNRLNGKNHRFNQAAYALIGQMDGQRTVQQIWDNSATTPTQTVPAQDEVIRLLGRLHDADLIQGNILPSTTEMFRQVENEQKQGWKQRVANPFSLRFPLFDPERLLEKCQGLTQLLFTRTIFVLWLIIVLSAVTSALVNWSDLSASMVNQLRSPGNLLLLWLLYPLIKILHELGHALAVKKWGGEVHEMGIILLALTPIPYVDATASASFPEKRQRIIVAAMGMMVELLLASIALFIWLNVETGLISSLAYNVMLIGGISTLLFNGNPLLRYDGYYILADLIEIPNLGQRSTRYLGYLLQRILLRNHNSESPVTAPGEAVWFAVYGPLSFCYRILVLIGLVWLVSSRFFFIGVLIALWGVISLMIIPAVRSLSQFLNSPTARNRRTQLILAGSGITLLAALLLFVFPLPLWTSTQGIIWLPEQALIRAGTDCEVVKVLVPNEQTVSKNQPLVSGADPFLAVEIAVYQAQLAELYARYNAQPLQERVKRKMLLDEIQLLKGDLQQTQEKEEKLLVRSPAAGKFILIDDQNLPGHFIRQGELLGYIIADHRPTIRTMINQNDIGLIREQVTGVEVRLAEQTNKTLQARIQRIVPAAELQLPSAALGTMGGGVIPVDLSDPDGLRALESHFQLDLSLPDEIKNPHIGERVYVRFEHGRMPLAMQLYRSLRQLLLRKSYV